MGTERVFAKNYFRNSAYGDFIVMFYCQQNNIHIHMIVYNFSCGVAQFMCGVVVFAEYLVLFMYEPSLSVHNNLNIIIHVNNIYLSYDNFIFLADFFLVKVLHTKHLIGL